MRAFLRSHIDRQTLITIRNLIRSINSRFTPLLTMSTSDASSPLEINQPATTSDPPPQLFDPLQPATPISYPLKTLEELESREYFNSFHYPFNKASVSFNFKSCELPDRPRMLVCHDMAGGYGDDKWIQGGDNADAYAIWHWYLIDVFVYFSHSLVTLPPPGWINTAHRHGVKVLGTFITEWDEGRVVSNKLLVTKESARLYADRLAELAVNLGFDGWLINMEVRLDEEKIPNLKEFVSHLTEKMHDGDANSLVIWYDSVTIDGKLNWQDQLNDQNKPFFDVCDGIFINYTWKESYPKLSGLNAGDRKFDVYMGIDAFGRGSYGGGQWNIDIALDILKRERISAAIFAPGWVYETNQPPDFQTAQNCWWSLIEKAWGLHRAYPDELPFCINFDQGRGFHFSFDGMQLSDKHWCNISLQSLQPFLSFSEDVACNVKASVNLKGESYRGGGCVTFKGTLEDEAYSVMRLFQGKICLGNSPVTFTYSVKSNENSRVGLSLDLVANSMELSSVFLAPWGDNLITMSQFVNKFSKVILPQKVTRAEGDPDWIIQECGLSMKGYTLTNINDVCYKASPGIIHNRLNYTSERQGMSSELGFHAMLGHIIAKSAERNSNFPSQTSWEIDGQFITLAKDSASLRSLSLKIIWNLKDASEFMFSSFNIFAVRHHSIPEFLGVAHTEAFYVSELSISSETLSLEFIIQASLLDGTFQSLENSPKLLLDIEGDGVRISHKRSV